MSNELIRRSALLEELNNFSMRIAGSVNDMAITIMEETKKSIVKMVDEQPAAYDVDKVVERLEETLLNLTFHKDNDSKIWNKAIHKAIEIAKSGGIE